MSNVTPVQEIADEIIEDALPITVPQVFTPAWNGFGKQVGTVKNAAEAMVNANLNWSVMLADCGWQGTNNGQTSFYPSKGFVATVRSDSLATLGIVSRKYKTVQNIDAFSFLDGLIGDGDMTVETAGVLDGGCKVWVLCNLPQVDEVADGDTSKRYLLFSNSHDGSSAVRCLPTSIRVVCQNTLALALKQGDGEGVTVRHSGDINEKLIIARNTLSLTLDIFDRHLADARKLVARAVTGDDVIGFLDRILPVPADKGNGRTLKLATREAITSNFYAHPLQLLPSIKGTAWALVNAATQHVDHAGRIRLTDGKTEAEARFNNSIYGTGAKVKRLAFDTAMELFAA